MQMSIGEIKRSYDQAKDKERQIGILADLNCCDHSEIGKILGIESIKTVKETTAPKPTYEPNLQDVRDMLFGKLEDIESQIKSLEDEYRKITVAIEVLGKVGT